MLLRFGCNNYISPKTIFEAIRIAKKYEIPVVADFENKINSNMKKILDMVDHIIVSKSFIISNYGDLDPKIIINRLWNNSKKLIAITYGQHGCYYRSNHNDEILHQPAIKTNTINSLGCGDVFHGAYAFALSNQKSIDECIKYASAAASLKASEKLINDSNIKQIMQKSY